jgi:hypothetical protein
MGFIQRNAVQSLPPVVQWANGHVEFRPAGDNHPFARLVGWYAEIGRNPEFDQAASAAGLARIEIRHRRDHGYDIVPHWRLGDVIRLFPITAGPVARTMAESMAPDKREATIAAGLGVCWETTTHGRSRLSVRGYLQYLANDSWTLAPGIVQVTVRSRMTDALLAALIDHNRVCERSEELIIREKHPDPVSFYELALPLGPGQEERWGGTTSVFTVRSLHPGVIDAEYLRSIWRPDAIAQTIPLIWDDVRAWAVAYSLSPSPAWTRDDGVTALPAPPVKDDGASAASAWTVPIGEPPASPPSADDDGGSPMHIMFRKR